MDGKSGYKYGNSGHCYTYESGNEPARKKAKQQAYIQGYAISQNSGKPFEKAEQDDFDSLNKELSSNNDVGIAKIDEERNLVFGWAYVSVNKSGEQVVDHSGDIIEDPQELEDAAYQFNLDFRDSGEMHKGDQVVGKLVESFVATPDKLEKMGAPKDSLPTGWWTGFYIEDDAVFQKIKKGQYKSFSIQGKGVRTPIK